MADEFGCHICLAHHSRKGGTGNLEDALGSQSFSGGVDTVMLAWRRTTDARLFRAEGRDDVDVERAELSMGADSWIELGENREADTDAVDEEVVLAAIADGHDTVNKMQPVCRIRRERLGTLLQGMLAAGLLTMEREGQRKVYRCVDG